MTHAEQLNARQTSRAFLAARSSSNEPRIDCLASCLAPVLFQPGFSLLYACTDPRPTALTTRQEQRRALIAEKRDMGAQAAEMQRGLRRLGLAGRLGVAARDLAQESIEVPQEAIGRVRATYLILFVMRSMHGGLLQQVRRQPSLPYTGW